MNLSKIITGLLLGFSFLGKAQYGTLLKTLERLEKRHGIQQSQIPIQWENKKFVHLQKNNQGIIEKKILSFDTNTVNLIEIQEDEKTEKITSKIFSGDFVFTNKNIVSIRLTKLENKNINIPKTLVFLLNKQEDIYYLIESISKQKWIEQNALLKKSPKNKKQ